MKALGLDIGTTSISAVVYDSNIGVLEARSAKNDSFLPGESWERLQDPDKIFHTALSLLDTLLKTHTSVAALGVTGQMHGIVYLDSCGNPVSPLYTWQDGRGDLPYSDGYSWADRLSEMTGYTLSSGYGMVTHFYNLHHGLIPENAAVFCTIHDYLAMKLSGRTRPVTDPTDAASLGLFDAVNGCFDTAALKKAGIACSFLPEIVEKPCIGTALCGIPVFTAIGDNQASFLGACGGRTDALLVNIGTGGQVSVYSPVYMQTETMETRPFPDGGWLLVGASLCGGRSYALLERFFRETVKMVTGNDGDAYSAMMHALDTCVPFSDLPIAVTTFQGTRKDPSKRGSFLNISADNFTPQHFIASVMQGMADELFALYKGYLDQGGTPPSVMIGSGNGLRKNRHLCRTFEKTFHCSMILSENEEEAACGAAIYAVTHAQ